MQDLARMCTYIKAGMSLETFYEVYEINNILVL